MMYLIFRIHINVKNYTQFFKIFDIYFSIVHISFHFALRNVKSCVAVDDIHIEGTVSQNFDSCLSFCFMSKNGKLSFKKFEYFFLNFIKKRTRRYIKNLIQFPPQQCC